MKITATLTRVKYRYIKDDTIEHGEIITDEQRFSERKAVKKLRTEKGIKNPDIVGIEKFARVYDVPADVLEPYALPDTAADQPTDTAADQHTNNTTEQ